MILFNQIMAFLAGRMVGSFLNVVIYRVPLGQSVVTPRSRCPQCGKLVCWYENIPLISYLLLRGKCSKCSFKIPLRYPLVELIMGLMAVYLLPDHFDRQGLYQFLSYFGIFAILLAHFFIDIDHQLLLDKLNILLFLIILPLAFFSRPLIFWVLGGVVGFLGPYLITWFFYKWRGQIGLGGGDIKLFGILGILLGVQGIVLNIFLSSFVGSVIGGTLILIKRLNRTQAMPFGPFIIIASVLQLYFPWTVDWFSRLLFP